MPEPPVLDLLPRQAVQLPQCGLLCLNNSRTKSRGCGSNAPDSCFCADLAYREIFNSCVAQNCTVREGLTTQRLANSACGIEPRIHHGSIPIYVLFTVLATIAVALRFAARHFRTMRVWWDDMATLTSLFSLLVFLSLATWGWKLGTGIDMWAVPVDNLDTIFKIYYTLINVYGLSRVCSRISVLLFYTRIFQNTPGRRIRIAVLVFDVICFAVIRSLAIFGCTPISHFWTGWDGEHVGRCINLEKTLIAAGVKDIVIDLVIIALPLPYIASLKLSKKKRIMSSILFSVGVIVIIICAVRLTTIRQFVESKNPTVDIMDLAVVSYVEISLGIICACLPSIRPLISKQYSPFRRGGWRRHKPKYTHSSRDTHDHHDRDNGASSETSLAQIHQSSNNNSETNGIRVTHDITVETTDRDDESKLPTYAIPLFEMVDPDDEDYYEGQKVGSGRSTTSTAHQLRKRGTMKTLKPPKTGPARFRPMTPTRSSGEGEEGSVEVERPEGGRGGEAHGVREGVEGGPQTPRSVYITGVPMRANAE